MKMDSTFNIRLATLTAVVAGMLLILSLPIASHAQSQPDVTGQERAVQAQGSGSDSATPNDDTATSGEAASNASEGRGTDAAGNSSRGLERAASNTPNETVRARLQTLQTLLAQLRALFEARFSAIGDAMRSGAADEDEADDTDEEDEESGEGSDDENATSTDEPSEDDPATTTDESTDDSATSSDGSVLGAHTTVVPTHIQEQLAQLRALVEALQERVFQLRGLRDGESVQENARNLGSDMQDIVNSARPGDDASEDGESEEESEDETGEEENEEEESEADEDGTSGQ